MKAIVSRTVLTLKKGAATRRISSYKMDNIVNEATGLTNSIWRYAQQIGTSDDSKGVLDSDEHQHRDS